MNNIKYLIVLILFFLSACSMKEAPMMKVYSINVPNVDKVANGTYADKILKIAYPVALNVVLDNKINYSYSISQSGVYLNSRWSNDFAKLFQGSIVQILMQSNLFKVVVPYSSNIRDNYRLEITIFDISHHVRGEASYAIFSIHCTLINTQTGELEKNRRFVYKQNTVTTDSRGYIDANNIIMTKFSTDLIKWLY